MRATRGAVALLLLGLSFPPFAAAQEAGGGGESAVPLDPKRAVVLVAARDGEAEGFAQSLALALAREAEAAGIAASRPEPYPYASSEPEAALRAAAAGGARWVLAARCAVEGSRLLWRAAAYDGKDGSLLGADGFSAYAGLSAMPQLEASAKAAVSAARLGSGGPAEREAPIEDRLTFASSDEGALVSLGGGESSFPLGEIEAGSLEAPYLAFKPGERILIGIDKEGYWPASRSFLVESGKSLALPPLMRKAKSALAFSYGSARWLGAGAAYRWYPLPDRLYLKAEDDLWCSYDFRSGARPVFHDELRLDCGAYLFLPPDSRFRLSAGAGLSGIATFIAASGLDEAWGFDLCLEPFFYTLEWHWPDWALVLEQRFPYSLGIEGGFLGRDWERTSSGQPFLTLSILLKNWGRK